MRPASPADAPGIAYADLRRGAEAHDPLGAHTDAAEHDSEGLERISAILIGLKSRGAALQMQRFVNEYEGEPLTAILPGATLLELWSITGVAERALMAVAVFVVAVGLIGMLTALLPSLNERRREMAILRSLGARPVHVLSLIVGEALFLTLMGVLLGMALLYLGLAMAQPVLEGEFGLFLSLSAPSLREWVLILIVISAGTLVGLIPGFRAYRNSLSDGLTVKL